MIIPAPRVAPTEATRRWAALLQQIFEVDPLACPTCHGAMRIVAFITQASVIDQILTHRRTRTAREAHAAPHGLLRTRATASRDTARAPRSSAHARPPTLRRSPEDTPPTPRDPAGPFGRRGGPAKAALVP